MFLILWIYYDVLFYFTLYSIFWFFVFFYNVSSEFLCFVLFALLFMVTLFVIDYFSCVIRHGVCVKYICSIGIIYVSEWEICDTAICLQKSNFLNIILWAWFLCVCIYVNIFLCLFISLTHSKFTYMFSSKMKPYWI